MILFLIELSRALQNTREPLSARSISNAWADGKHEIILGTL